MRLFLFVKRLLFPGLDISVRKRMKFAKYFKSGDILTLDAGCGNGAFSFEAVKKGNRVIGVDFDVEKLKRCEEFRDYLKINSQRCRFKVHNLYELKLLGEKFDQIICFETLEHIKDDRRIIAVFSQVMKPDGLLHLCAPSADRKPYYGETISNIEDGNHLRLGYTFDQLAEMLNKEGFKIINRDSAVGFIGQKLIDLNNWIDIAFLKNKSGRIKDLAHFIIFIILYPFTLFDAIILSRPLNIYVAAKKKTDNEFRDDKKS
jgi:SAM-dependent methyltransferase